MTRAIRIHKTGGPEVLQLDTVDPGKPGPGQALVRHKAIGINFIDTYTAQPAGRCRGIGSGGEGSVRGHAREAGRPTAYAGLAPPGSYAEAGWRRSTFLPDE